MPGEVPSRAELVERLLAAGRELIAAAAMFHTALATRQGLTATDVKALDLLDRSGPLTPRELSHRSGLAPASVTGLVDRLVRKGFVRRVPHPDDRRSVLVEPVPDRPAGPASTAADYLASMTGLLEHYRDEDLATVAGFLTEAAARQRAAAGRLAEHPAPPGGFTADSDGNR